jgi:hypothetical protein
MPDPIQIFEEANRRREQLLQLLSVAPIVAVSGVVSAMGVSGGRSRGEELWSLRFSFESWRIAGGQVQTRPLTVRRNVSDTDLRSLQERIDPYAVIRIKARVVTDPPTGGWEALLEELIGPDNSDVELKACAAKLQEPVYLDDPTFGRFTLDRRIKSFNGSAEWMGKGVTLSFSAGNSSDTQAALSTANSLWQDQQDWDARTRDCAVKKLLELKNGEWLNEDEEELTPAQFKERMLLESVTVNPDGSFDFWYKDSDMFGGHAILVSGNVMSGPTDAGIEG